MTPSRTDWLIALVPALAGFQLEARAATASGTDSGGDVRAAIQAVRTDTPPLIDGKLDEAVWTHAAVVDDLRQIRPGDGAPASERTIVYVLYDKDAIYIGARMWDSGAPREITRNTLKQGASLREDDRIAIVLDPFNSRRRGYRFEVNANGVRNDMLYQGGGWQSEWSTIWEAAGSVIEDGWIAEMAIPIKSLPFDPGIDTWGFNVSRAIRRRGEEVVWVSRNRTFHPGIVGTLNGLRDLDRGIGLDVVPGYSLTNHRSFVNSASTVQGEPSLNLYYRITPSLTGSLTFNTDFSASEVDERQVNLTRFSPFFPEKRDFFLNDADLFEFGRIGTAGFDENTRSVGRPAQENGRPFFSRRIGLSPLGTPVEIEYGGKLSGSIGRINAGVLGVHQGEFVYPNGDRVEPQTLAVARVTANVLGESTIGAIITSGNPTSNRDNSVVGLDFIYSNTRLSRNRSLQAEAWFQKSDTEGLEGDDLAFGFGVRMPNTNGLRGGIGMRQIEQNFFPALGFVNRTDIRDVFGELGYIRMLGGRFLQAIYAGADAQRVTSLTSGDLLTKIVSFRPLEIETRGDDLLRLIYSRNEEHVVEPFAIYNTSVRSVVVPVGRYTFDDYGFDLETGPHRSLAGELRLRTGEFFDGHRKNIGGSLVWKQSRYFTLRSAFDWNDIDLPQGSFVTRLASTTTEVSFSAQLSWISILQYDDVSEIFGIHSRLVWIPKAGRQFFLVLNRNFHDSDKDGSFRSLTSELTARVSYTFRF